jgi:redox-sensitive bicupin YhaK (pirin superfamily)
VTASDVEASEGQSGSDVWDSRVTEVGGLEVHRALPRRARRTVGAWCFVDEFGPLQVDDDHAMRVGPHPHMGLHTVTWLISGQAIHTDSLGTEQPLRPGQVNLMTAGRGIAHAEVAPPTYRGLSLGAQLWVAQPEATRNGRPAFAHLADPPRIEFGRAVATVLLGELPGARSPLAVDTALVGADIQLQGASDVPVDTRFEHGVFVLGGAMTVDGQLLTANQSAYLAPGRSEAHFDTSGQARLLLLGGEPFAETLLMWWNFVARSRDEVEHAVKDWNQRSDRFGRVSSSLGRIPAPAPSWSPAGRSG